MLCSCDGADKYGGKWKATNPKGEHFDIQFMSEFLTINGDSYDSTAIGYNQYSYSLKDKGYIIKCYNIPCQF